MLKIMFSILITAGLVLSGPATDHEIDQTDKTFSRTEITIEPGDKLTFKNNDEVTHNVYSVTPGMSFDLHRQAPGASSTITFDKEGTAVIQCSIHPKMKLIVHVQR
jgi:plastocyanin